MRSVIRFLNIDTYLCVNSRAEQRQDLLAETLPPVQGRVNQLAPADDSSYKSCLVFFGSQRFKTLDTMPRLFLFIIGLAVLGASACCASTITVVGENGTNADRWRTATISKVINPAKNNIYGNDGYVMFNNAPSNSTPIQSNSPVNPFTFTSSTQGLAPSV